MSRIIERRYLLDDAEKERFLRTMRLLEAFTGVRVITFSVLDTHFHLVLEVSSSEPVTEAMVISRVKALYGKRFGEAFAGEVRALREKGADTAAEGLLDTYRWRMNDLSVFMQGATHAKGGTSTDAFRQQAEEVLAQGGKLSAVELIHCRVRYFSDGVVFGGQRFVDETFQRYRDQFGLKRRTGPRKLKQTRLSDLFTMRDLRLDPLGIP